MIELKKINKTKNTKPELAIRSLLWSKGYRYKIHDKKLPGKPDIVLPKHKAIINIQGCFWHNHGCNKSNLPKTRTAYWYNELESNKERDFVNKSRLKELGWKVIDLWECTLIKNELTKTMQKLERMLSLTLN
jgi:DNA mismatch endonuclease (patch repair protein)